MDYLPRTQKGNNYSSQARSCTGCLCFSESHFPRSHSLEAPEPQHCRIRADKVKSGRQWNHGTNQLSHPNDKQQRRPGAVVCHNNLIANKQKNRTKRRIFSAREQVLSSPFCNSIIEERIHFYLWLKLQFLSAEKVTQAVSR